MKIALSIILLLTLLGGSFVLGARYGVDAFYGLNAQYMASLSYSKLYQLRLGKLDGVESALQFEIDHQMVMYIKGKDSKFGILWPEMGRSESPLFLKAIEYRRKSPWPFLGIDDLGLIDERDLDRFQKDSKLLEEYMENVLQYNLNN